MKSFLRLQIKNRVMSYLTVGALFLALLTPLFLQPHSNSKNAKVTDYQVVEVVDEIEVAEKEDGESLARRRFPRRDKSEEPKIARAYAWSD